MRGVPEEGDPSVQNGTFINGFYEEWPIVYSEAAYGFARTGQTMLNVTDSKIIRLFVDDEPFGVAGTNIRHYDRRLNLKAGTLDREATLGNSIRQAGADKNPPAGFLQAQARGGYFL